MSVPKVSVLARVDCTFIRKANSKFFRQSSSLSRAARADANLFSSDNVFSISCTTNNVINSLRKHPFLLALRRWGQERGETDVFAGYVIKDN